MTYAEEVFNREMERATRMQKVMFGYWTGYAAGLMRARFGRVAVPDTYHDAWSPDDAAGDQARGYRDGYATLVAPATAPEPTSGAQAR
jgi:hypothetical protein